VYVGTGVGSRNIEFCPLLLYTVTTAVSPLTPGGGMTLAWEASTIVVSPGRPSK
jgi:hypothetical protein